MSDLYTTMAGVARALLAPTSRGGLGQGQIEIVRSTTPAPDPTKPWEPVVPVKAREMVDAIGSKDTEFRSGETVISADFAFLIVPPVNGVDAGDQVIVNGNNLVVLKCSPYPAVGPIQTHVKIYCTR